MRWSILLSLFLAIQTELVLAEGKGAELARRYALQDDDVSSWKKVEKAEQPLSKSKSISVNKKDISVGIPIDFELDIWGTAERCVAMHNDVFYEIYPNMNLTSASSDKQGNACGFTLHIGWEYAGNWTLTGYYQESNKSVSYSSFYELRVYKRAIVQPSPEVTLRSGYATFYLPSVFDNPTSCQIKNDEGKTYELLNPIDPAEGIELYKICGVRMRYDKSRLGRWTITQSRGNYNEIMATFRIYEAFDTERPKITQLIWERGASETLELTARDATYCDVVTPDGVVIPLSYECKYTLNVTDKHAGVWKGRHGSVHSMKLVEEEYNVEVWNPEALEISVSYEDDGVNMLCRTGLRSLSNCMFKSPNGTVISLQAGVGDGNYEYYGTGFALASRNQPKKRAECGLMIRNPSAYDYGVWKCSMKDISVRKKEITLQGLIDVQNSKGKRLDGEIVSSSPVYVKRGSEFVIRCSTNAPLNFCWMRSPNGTMYSVTKNERGGNLLRYNGEGLSMGVCGAVVENADDTHRGDWSCRLGVVGAAEVESIVPVTVTESELISEIENISTHQGKSTILSCRTLPSSEATIDYCRWVRPNGDGIYRNTASRYVTRQKNDGCMLTLNAVADEDFGTWTCLARLTTGSDVEVWSKIELKEKLDTAIAANATLRTVAFALLGAILICGIFVIIAMYYRKNRQTSTPAYDINYFYPKNPDVKVIPFFTDTKIPEKIAKQ
ncbi:uncharacterized protein [Fopius arisanus]|uniref:Uncharacterized protein isoform X3 n=1 Tax=Fopius arisanus TaxID=64838 RepID=A0A9R1SUV4_9HYME|nr:PREDICTED: uncharacterized protein LOC105263223 isoform X3 [Fopius arisanus]